MRPLPRRDSQAESPRNRLKELKQQGILDAAIYGTKQQLGVRLVKRDAQIDENIRTKAANEERQRRVQEGADLELPKRLMTPISRAQ